MKGIRGILQELAVIALFMQVANAQLRWKNFTNPNALCNDFTQAGYYIHLNTSSTDWVIFFESGGACYSVETCNRRYLRREIRMEYDGGLITDDFDLPRAYEENRNRSRRMFVSPLMTSIGSLDDEGLYEIEGRDLLSTNCKINPDFCMHNHVLVPYCSSDLWLGNDFRFNSTYLATYKFSYDPTAKNLQFIFRGYVIFQTAIKEVFPQTFNGNILLAGSSAGGVGVINHSKWVKQHLPNAKIRVFTESSWFVNFHDNIYQRFTDFVNISEDSRASNFNITEYVGEQNDTLLSLIIHHEPCNSVELGTLCCISAHCLISNPNYFPNDVPILVASSLNDVYLLAPSLRGMVPFNVQENSFEANFDKGQESEPVGLNFNFLQIIGEYGGVMNSTLGTTLHQAGHMSVYVTSCFQHIYLATSSLWDEDGLFGTDAFEVTNEDGVTLLKHTVESGRWNKFNLMTQGQDSTSTPGVSLRDAVGIWLTTANETNPVEFRDFCFTAHCNELCPEEINIELSNSYLWSDATEIFIYCIVGMITLVCFIMKGIFFVWHWRLLKNQRVFLEHRSVTDAGNATSEFRECTEKISIACLNLRYSVPFSSKIHSGESNKHDVNPIILPVFHDKCNDGDQDVVSDNSIQGNSEPPYTVIDNNNIVLTSYRQINDRESGASSSSGFVNGVEPLLSGGTEKQEAYLEHAMHKMIVDGTEKKTTCHLEGVEEKVKTILKGISLYFNPGQLVAIMGPSGSGKTTFLDLLTGRRKYGTIGGEIYVNGMKLDDIREWYVTNSGYVLQLAMPYYEELTVRENLTLSAQMRLSSEFTLHQKFERVEQVMYETGLQSLADTVVGSVVGAGLSGGQKKRLTIAQQLLRLPSVLYLDEPTSGLDSASSYELLTYLNRLAGSQRTVIMTIHQPRMEIFHMFTRLIMLCEGQVAYHGTPAKAYEVFITALKVHYLEKGLALPELEDHNPADVIMDMLGNAKMREAILRYYQESGDPDAVYSAIKASEDDEDVTDNNHMGYFYNVFFGKKRVFQQQGSMINRVGSLEARASLRTSTGQVAYLPVIFFLYGFILGTVYIQTTSALLIVSGFCVYSVASALFMFPIMHTYYSQALALYQLEHSDGIGMASDLVIQGFSRFVFLGLIPLTLCASILYLLVVQVSSYNFTVYLQVLVVNMALNQTWIALLIFVLAGFPTIAFRLSPVISSVAGFTSGFFIPRDSMPPWYRWLFYINPNYYGFSSTSYLLLTNFDSHCAGTELECYITTGEYTLTQFNFEETNPAFHIMVLLIMTFIYLLLAVFALWVRHTDFKLVLKSWLLRNKRETSNYDTWSNSQSLYGHHKESDHQLYDIEMLELEDSEVGTNTDQLTIVGETCFENSHASEHLGQSSDMVAQGSPGTGDNKTPLQQLFHTPEDPSSGDPHKKPAAPPVSGDNVSKENIPSQLPTQTKVSFSTPTTSTQRKFSCPTVVTHEQLSVRRRSLGFQSKFLNDNEDHVIWKPERSVLNKRLSIIPSRDSEGTKSKLQNDDGISQTSEIPPLSFNDFRLRQQQLLERVNVAREVTKDQNSDLCQPEMSQEDKKMTLKLASQYVSYRISQKPRGLSDVVFQAMDRKKSASLVNTDRPLTTKEKWQKITVLASTATPPQQDTVGITSTSKLEVINEDEAEEVSADNTAQLDGEVDGELEGKEQTVVSLSHTSPTNTMGNTGNANSLTVMDDQTKTVLF